jgi:hypothetical protein
LMSLSGGLTQPWLPRPRRLYRRNPVWQDTGLPLLCRVEKFLQWEQSASAGTAGG